MRYKRGRYLNTKAFENPVNFLLKKAVGSNVDMAVQESSRVKLWLTSSDICSMMRKHKKTISGIAKEWNITQKRVRFVRAHGVTGLYFVMDWTQFTTGCSFTRTDAGDWIIVPAIHRH